MSKKSCIKTINNLTRIIILLLCFTIILMTCACTSEKNKNAAIDISVLLLPKFEIGEMTGDAYGEAQRYYEAYCAGGEEYEIAGGFDGHKLYVKDGIALYVTGMGKVNAGLSLQAVLSDKRFDFSDAYLIGIGCAGSAYESTVMGDVFIVTAAVDFDLGHRVDIRDTSDGDKNTWYQDSSYNSSSCKFLNAELMDKVYNLVKDIPIDTTEKTRNYMAKAFDNAEWATRDPQILRATAISSDSYWKGTYMHQDAIRATAMYKCPDPYLASEMEDVALAVAAERMGMLDRLIIIRNSVNMDVFMNGATPESLWNPNSSQPLSSGSNEETADIFTVSNDNNFKVGSAIIDAIKNGSF